MVLMKSDSILKARFEHWLLQQWPERGRGSRAQIPPLQRKSGFHTSEVCQIFSCEPHTTSMPLPCLLTNNQVSSQSHSPASPGLLPELSRWAQFLVCPYICSPSQAHTRLFGPEKELGVFGVCGHGYVVFCHVRKSEKLKKLPEISHLLS